MPPSDTIIKLGVPADDKPARAVSETVAAHRLKDGAAARLDLAIAAEVPVALVYNGVSHVVMMATPADLADFAVGFSLSEGIVPGIAAIRDLAVTDGEDGVQVEIEIAPEAHAGLAERRRNLAGRTGCGLCGVDELAQVERPLGRVGAGHKIELAVVRRALDALSAHQTLNKTTGAVHAAAWAGADGEIRLAREDVGRHNALDKLIGAMARAGVDPQSGFAVITSRCSFEMVQKAATVNIPFLVAISAPTAMALKIAERAGVTLVALARADSVTLYANPGRVAGLKKADR